MTRTLAGRLSAVLLVTLLAAAVPAVVQAAESVSASVDVTPAIAHSATGIDGLKATEVGDIVVLRGRAVSREAAINATNLVKALGYTRVANLIQVIEPADDVAIQRVAERQLGMARGLEGCSFTVASQNGVVSLDGRVQSELQKDMAVALLRNINGVRGVNASLTK